MWKIINDAGWPIYPLLLASIISVALIIERIIALRKSKVLPPQLLPELLALYQSKQVTPDVINKVESNSPLGRVLAAGLRNDKSSRYVMKEAIEEAGRIVTHELERFLNGLGTIATASPLMGLFGTVVGMIEIFGASSPSGTNPQALAHGISVALYNTGFGIMIAVPALIAYRYVRAVVEDYVVEMEQSAIKLLDLAHGNRTA